MQRHSMQKASEELDASIQTGVDGYFQGLKVGFTSAGLYDMPANDPQYSSLGEEQYSAVYAQRQVIVDEATQVARAKMDEVGGTSVD